MKRKAKDIRCYKYSTNEGFWSLVAGDDPYLCNQFFMKEYKIKEKDFRKNIKVEKINKSYKVWTPYFKRPISVSSLFKVIKFFPRVLSDSIE